MLGVVGAAWGLAGLIALLVFAVYRLGGVVVAGLEHPWAWQHVAVATGNAVAELPPHAFAATTFRLA